MTLTNMPYVSPFLNMSASSRNMNLGLVNDMNKSKWLEGYASIIQPFNSNTVSLLVKYILSLLEKISFNLLISLVARSMLGPVTMHI